MKCILNFLTHFLWTQINHFLNLWKQTDVLDTLGKVAIRVLSSISHIKIIYDTENSVFSQSLFLYLKYILWMHSKVYTKSWNKIHYALEILTKIFTGEVICCLGLPSK